MVCKTPKILYAREIQRRRYWMPLPTRPLDHFEAKEWDLRHRKEVPCGACYNCAQDRISEMTGMCLAEACTSDDVLLMTCTYSPEGLRGRKKLREPLRFDAEGRSDDMYSDVQKMVKRLRRRLNCDGIERSVRYLVAGEYGGFKGRPHWHLILFFKGCRLEEVTLDEAMEGKREPWAICFPDRYGMYGARSREERKARDDAARISWEGWAHGWSWFERPETAAAYRYALKYTLKGKRAEAMAEREAMKPRGFKLDREGRAPFYRWSLKPTLGGEFFQRLAVDRAMQRLPPNDFRYWPGDGWQRDNQTRQYFVVRHSARRKYARQYIETLARLQVEGRAPINSAVRNRFAPEVEKLLPLSVSEFMAEDAKRRGKPRFDAEEWRETFQRRREENAAEFSRDRQERSERGEPVFKEHGLGWIAKEYGLFRGIPCVVGIWQDGRRSVWSGVDGVVVQWFKPDQRAFFERDFKPVFDRVERERIEAVVQRVAERNRPVVDLNDPGTGPPGRPEVAGAENFRSWRD